MQIQVYLNGHEWLARKLEANHVPYSKLDKVLTSVGDIRKAQKFADRFQRLKWPKILNRYARLVNPQMQDILRPFEYYWVTTQSEYSTDNQFKSREDLCELYMRKGVSWLFRYREVSLKANSRYLDALAVVDDPTNPKRDLDRITNRKKDAAGRGCSGFNPLAPRDTGIA